MAMNQKSCNLADCWQELITRCGFSVSIEEKGVHVSENCTNGRHGWYPDGITALSAFHLQIIENVQERVFVLQAERDAALRECERLKAPVSDVRIQALKDAIVAQCDNGKDCPGSEKDHGIGDFFSRCSAYRLWKLLNKELEAELSRRSAPVSDEEWGKGCHLANRSHVNDIIANRAKQEKP